jgi:hypothetical protein
VEVVQLEQGLSFEKLLAFGLAASIPNLLLIEARDGLVQVAGDVVLNGVELDCLSVVGEGLEGRTKAQQNPHVNRSLAWVSWVIARLRGWKGYVSERPARTKTMSLGLRRFFDLFKVGRCSGIEMCANRSYGGRRKFYCYFVWLENGYLQIADRYLLPSPNDSGRLNIRGATGWNKTGNKCGDKG